MCLDIRCGVRRGRDVVAQVVPCAIYLSRNEKVWLVDPRGLGGREIITIIFAWTGP